MTGVVEPLLQGERGQLAAGVEPLDDAGSSLAASFDLAANAWVALSATKGVVEVPVDADWQEVPRDVPRTQAPLAAAPPGQALLCLICRCCWSATCMACSRCAVSCCSPVPSQ